VTVRGSDTLVVLMQRWAERWSTTGRSTSVEVSGGGTGTGISALVDGTTDVASASRAMTAKERADVEATGAKVVETKVAIDAVAIYVNPSNPVASVSLAELDRIYRGKIRRWSDVGGVDAPIVAYSRENSSGTYLFFKEHVLAKRDFAAEVQSLPGTAAVVQAVMHDRNAIGYGGIAASSGVKVLAVRGASGTPVAPTLATATDRSYPLARPLFVYHRSDASADARAFVSWLRSDEAQALAESAGFYPIPKEAP
jgi:phosphate transport system substrate-binding protein